MAVIDTLTIDRAFVERWAMEFDLRAASDSDDGPAGSHGCAIRRRLEEHPEPKHLHKDWFVTLACWKSPRSRGRYLSNDEGRVKEATQQALAFEDDLDKLRALTTLDGVGSRVASAILHFMDERRFALFDYHCCEALRRAGLWRRSKHDFGEDAWLDYQGVVRELSGRLEVSLRRLDKALWAYDKWG